LRHILRVPQFPAWWRPHSRGTRTIYRPPIQAHARERRDFSCACNWMELRSSSLLYWSSDGIQYKAVFRPNQHSPKRFDKNFTFAENIQFERIDHTGLGGWKVAPWH